jgi:hypothetical protein
MATSPTNWQPSLLLDPKILTTTASAHAYTAPNGADDAGVELVIFVVNYGSAPALFKVDFTPSGGSAIQIVGWSVPADGVVYPQDIIRFIDKNDKLELYTDTATTLKAWIAGTLLDTA